MSNEALEPLADQNAIRGCLGQIQAGQQDFARFFAEAFEELTVLEAEIIREHEQWQAEHRRAESELALQVAHLDQQRAELAAGGAEAAHLAKVSADLADARHELAEARAEISRQREQLKAARSAPDPQISEKLRAAEQECMSLKHERTLLETELEAVRSRAAELAENLAAQKRQMDQQQAKWEEELRRQGSLLEKLVIRVDQRPPAAAPAPQYDGQPTPESSTTHGSSPVPGDLVLDSVMAQFEMLQKDVARRRAKAKESAGPDPAVEAGHAAPAQ